MVNGIGSAFDVDKIVDDIMTVQKIDLQRLEKKKALLLNQQDAYSQLRKTFKNFTDKVDDLNSILNKNMLTVKSSNETVASAVLNAQNATAGTYAIKVNQLAQAHQISSSAFSSEDQALMIQGSLSVTSGSNSFTLAISETDTLDSIRDHINSSAMNQGISASILKTTNVIGQDEYRLVLTARNTGTANEMVLSGDALTSLSLNNQIQAAQDANFTINDLQVIRSSNVISDVLSGVTFNLNSSSGSANIVIAADTTNAQSLIKDSLQKVLESYNMVIELLAKNQAARATRDSTYSLIKLNLKNTMAQVVGNSSVNSLLSMGVILAPAETKILEERIRDEQKQEDKIVLVEYAVEGKLIIDTKFNRLDNVLQNNLTDVRSFFSGAGANFKDAIDSGISGIETKTIYNREKLIGEESTYLNRKINREESRLGELRKTLKVKYAALNTYLSKYSEMSDFLSKQLEMMNPPRGR